MSQDVIDAFVATAEHFGVPVTEVTRNMIRQARDEGVHDVPERAIGNHSEARARAAVPLVPIPKGHHVKGVSTLVGPDGQTKGQWVKTAKTYENREELLTRLMTELPTKVPVRQGSIPAPLRPYPEHHLAVYPLGDAHIGMMSWGRETGHNFDLEIATRITEQAIDELVIQGARASTALLINVGDFFHSDTLHNTTTKGTPLDTDGRMFKILQVGRDLRIYMIDRALETHNHVHVVEMSGNHDRVTSIFLNLCLDAHYRNEPRVTVHASPSPFFYYRFGNNLVGSTHGDLVKLSELQKIMSVDRRKDWGEIENAFWYLGHVHHTRRVEDYGCTIETFPTLAPSDAWHNAKGYRSSRDMNRIVIHSEDGEVSRSRVSAQALERRYRATMRA